MYLKRCEKWRGDWRMSGPDGPRHGGGGRPRGGRFGGGRGGPFGERGGRFDSGALRLVVLALIAEEARHGYDIIKAIEAKFQGAYSPSPGAIYPMLQMLEESDLVTSQAAGSKRLYSITDEGRSFLDLHRAELDRVNARIDGAATKAGGSGIGEEVQAMRWTVFSRLRGGAWSPEQAEKAREILKKARRDIEDL